MFERSIKQRHMINAKKQKCRKVLIDFIVFFPWRNRVVWLTLLISLIFLLLLLLNSSHSIECIHKTEDILSNANLAIMGIDMAALAILFALFQGKQLTCEAKKAFKEQCGVFLFNAVMQLMSLIVFILCIILSLNIVLYVSFLFQIWALLLVFDVIVELFTLISAIINK